MKALLLALALLILPWQALAMPYATLNTAVVEMSDYYTELYALTGQPYHDPTVFIVYEDEKDGPTKYQGACGMISSGFFAFYCPLDETIVLEDKEMDGLAKVDEFLPMFVMAHEWGHHIQFLAGMDREMLPKDGDWNQVYSIELELMADCLGGAWAGHLEAADELDITDLSQLVVMMSTMFGDSGTYPPTAGDAHGTEAQRVGAMLSGYSHGYLGCMTLKPLPR